MNNVVGHFIILAGAGIAACALSLAFGRPDQAASPDEAAVVVVLPQRAGEPERVRLSRNLQGRSPFRATASRSLVSCSAS